jgi:hypothetical protein
VEATDPVTSPLWAALGFSPKRVDSALQPAAKSAIDTSAIARGHDDERNDSVKDFMSCSLVRNKQGGELTGRKLIRL